MSPGALRGTWQPGDHPGRRQFVDLKGPDDQAFSFEAGGSLPKVTVAYETWGRLNDDRSNAVLVLHALTGDAHAQGPTGPGQLTPGWWDGLIGPGAPVDTDEFFAICPNVLGGCQGSTGPSSTGPDGRPLGSRFPRLTIRDQVAVEVALADALGVSRWYAVVGGSMGGMRALEWSVTFPSRVARAVLLSTTAAASAEQIAQCSLQARAVRNDPAFRGGDYYDDARPLDGLSLARGMGQLTYRTEAELRERFRRHSQGSEEPLEGGRYAVESYLEYQGDKLGGRFDPNSYVVLSEAMNHHDVGRGRGGVAAALEAITASVSVAGIASDRLYPLYQQEELARLIPGAAAPLVIDSAFGHDGFLLEIDAVGELVSRALRAP